MKYAFYIYGSYAAVIVLFISLIAYGLIKYRAIVKALKELS